MNKEFFFYFFITGVSLLTMLAIGLVIMLIKYKQRQVRHKNELLHTRLEVQEESMNLISEEIHDNIGQLLSLSRMYAQSISLKTIDLPIHSVANKMCELLTKAIDDLRYISHSLNGERMEKLGLIPSIQREIEYLETATGLTCDIQFTGKIYNLNREQNLLIFRILQEALQNIIKHAKASELKLLFNYTDETLHIEIADNGKGFDVEKADENGSLGLRNIKNRVRLLSGKWNIQSQSGKGTNLSVVIPIKSYGA